MVQVYELMSGVTLRCFPADKFKQGSLSIQFLRQMRREEAAVNALIPAVLLRGTEKHRDLRDITLHLDDLYGASVGAVVRRIGDYQTMGLYCGFIEDRSALNGDRILEPMMDFVGELLLEPLLVEGGFSPEFVASEKKNLIAAIESERNDKRAYASAQLFRKMCAGDPYGIPRLGEAEQVEKIDPVAAYRHYRNVLTESPVEIFYVGSGDPNVVAQGMKRIFAQIPRNPQTLPAQTAFQDAGGGDYSETMEISQGKLGLGFVTPITNRSEDFPAMQVFNTVFGAGMTSKLFANVREKMSLCYAIGSGYYGAKGILTVFAGIDCDKEPVVKEEVLRQLALCQAGEISEEELTAAREAILSGLRGVHDSPAAIESYETVAAIGGLKLTVPEYRAAVEKITVADVARVASTLRLHTTFFLKGVHV